jgi:hypothetical protein
VSVPSAPAVPVGAARHRSAAPQRGRAADRKSVSRHNARVKTRVGPERHRQGIPAGAGPAGAPAGAGTGNGTRQDCGAGARALPPLTIPVPTLALPVLAWLPAGGSNGTVGNSTNRAGYPSTAAESSSLSSFALQPSRGSGERSRGQHTPAPLMASPRSNMKIMNTNQINQSKNTQTTCALLLRALDRLSPQTFFFCIYIYKTWVCGDQSTRTPPFRLFGAHNRARLPREHGRHLPLLATTSTAH